MIVRDWPIGRSAGGSVSAVIVSVQVTRSPVEALEPPSGLVAEARLRPLTDPMRMNGCAMIVLNDPGLEAPLQAACGWVVQALGEPGGGARVWRLT